jgi:GDP-D-mannose 3',5'-epimerase
MKKALVLGGGGFIGGHMVQRLKSEGYWVMTVDIQRPEFRAEVEDIFLQADLRLDSTWEEIANTNDFDELYQFAADMGGAGYINAGEHDAEVMHNSALINLHTINYLSNHTKTKAFYASSACVYPEYNQQDPQNPKCVENSVYPAMPDTEYGWEKLFSERMYKAAEKQYGLDIRIGRFHNIFGIQGTWQGGKEKAPAALCRKIAEVAKSQDKTIEVWGDGEQTRSFLYVDDCIEAVRRLMWSDYKEPINIGSDQLISINEFVQLISSIAGFDVNVKHIEGPQGVRGRVSDNTLIQEVLDWEPSVTLKEGLGLTYHWIYDQIYVY